MKFIIYIPVKIFLLYTKKVIPWTRLLGDFYIEFAFILKTVRTNDNCFTNENALWTIWRFDTSTDFVCASFCWIEVNAMKEADKFIINEPRNLLFTRFENFVSVAVNFVDYNTHCAIAKTVRANDNCFTNENALWTIWRFDTSTDFVCASFCWIEVNAMKEADKFIINEPRNLLFTRFENFVSVAVNFVDYNTHCAIAKTVRANDNCFTSKGSSRAIYSFIISTDFISSSFTRIEINSRTSRCRSRVFTIDRPMKFNLAFFKKSKWSTRMFFVSNFNITIRSPDNKLRWSRNNRKSFKISTYKFHIINSKIDRIWTNT